MWISLTFFLALIYVVVIDVVHMYALYAYLLMSVVTWLVYAWDKRSARKGRWRIQEKTLHILSVFGGWPGALLAQQKLRHKSSKRSFLWLYYLTVLINLLFVIWFVQSETGALIRSWFNQ